MLQVVCNMSQFPLRDSCPSSCRQWTKTYLGFLFTGNLVDSRPIVVTRLTSLIDTSQEKRKKGITFKLDDANRIRIIIKHIAGWIRKVYALYSSNRRQQTHTPVQSLIFYSSILPFASKLSNNFRCVSRASASRSIALPSIIRTKRSSVGGPLSRCPVAATRNPRSRFSAASHRRYIFERSGRSFLHRPRLPGGRERVWRTHDGQRTRSFPPPLHFHFHFSSTLFSILRPALSHLLVSLHSLPTLRLPARFIVRRSLSAV